MLSSRSQRVLVVTSAPISVRASLVALTATSLSVTLGLALAQTVIFVYPSPIRFFQAAADPPNTWRSPMFQANWTPVHEGQVWGANIWLDAAGNVDQNGNPVSAGDPEFHPARYLHDFSYAGYHSGNDPIPPLVQRDCLQRGRPVFRVTDYGCTPNPTPRSAGQDCRAAITAAMNAASVSGGIVYFPAGEYRITTEERTNARSNIFDLSSSNVVICGAGVSSTFIKVDPRRSGGSICREVDSNDLQYRTFCAHEVSIFAAEPAGESSNGWLLHNTSKSATLARDYSYSTMRLELSSMPFARGDEIVIYAGTRTASYLAEHDMDDPQGWSATERSYVFRRKVADIVGNEIVLDVPTRYRLRRSDNVRVIAMAAGHEGLQELGIEQLSIGMVRHPDDWDTSSCPGTKDPQDCQDERDTDGSFLYPVLREIYDQRMIDWANVSNSYIYDIATYRPTENTSLASFTRGGSTNSYPIEFLNSAIYMKHSRFNTVDTIRVQGSQVDRGNHNGYALWLYETNEVLFQNGQLRQVKKGFAFNNGGTSGNVVKDMLFADILDYENDFHSYLSMSNLIDNNTVDGTYWEAAVRPLGTTRHGHGTTETVFWNTRGLTDPAVNPTRWIDTNTWWDKDNNNDGAVDSPGILDYGVIVSDQYGWGYIIGTYGAFSDVVTPRMPNRAYTSADPWSPSVMPRDWTEGIGYDSSSDPRYAGKTLYPRSLYEAQLALRLGGTPPPPPPGCTPNWTCTSWSTCSSGTQTRTCTDSNNCGTATGQPALSQSCSVTPPPPPPPPPAGGAGSLPSWCAL